MFDSNWRCSGWEVIAEDESKEADQHGSLGNLDSSPGTSGHKMGHGSSGKMILIRVLYEEVINSLFYVFAQWQGNEHFHVFIVTRGKK